VDFLYLVISNRTDTLFEVKAVSPSETAAQDEAREWQGMVIKVPAEVISDYRPHYRK